MVLADAIAKGASVEEREAAVAGWKKKMLDRAETFATYSFKHLNAMINPRAPASALEAMKGFMESEIRREA